jgi:hypothetical protein
MSRTVVLAIVCSVLALGGSGYALASPLEDDLALVKRATATAQEPRPTEPAPVVAPRKSGREPEWLKVRILEKGSKRAKMTVNVPLALVRAVGDDFPVRWHCRKDDKPEARCSIRVSDVLKTLESGQDLVQIDDDDATVRIWVE